MKGRKRGPHYQSCVALGFTEHTLVKFEIMSGVYDSVIYHSSEPLSKLLRTVSDKYFMWVTLYFEFDKCVFSQNVTHD